MANADERIWRTANGQLVSEAAVQDGASGGFGTTLAYAVGDELTDEDAKLFKSGAKPTAKVATSEPLSSTFGGAQPEKRADAATVAASKK